MPPRDILFVATLALLAPCKSWGGDVVQDWNTYAMQAVKASGEWGPRSSRAMAMIHAAIFDAINATEGRFVPYHYTGLVPDGASADAAAASAAHYLLARLFPPQRARSEKRYRAFLQTLPEHEGKADGIRLGERIGAAYWALRLADGADVINTYKPAAASGVYVPTSIPIDPVWGTVKPWLLQSPAQFRPTAPP